MKQGNFDDVENLTAPRTRIQLPPPVAATPEELARRHELVDRIRRIQEEIGPLDIDVVELIDADFYEFDADRE